MATLITILGIGKGTWAEVHAILDLKAFEHVLVFIDEWAAKEYRSEHDVTMTPIPEVLTTTELSLLMAERIKQHLLAADNTAEFDLAVNIASGSGKQHAALITAILKLGYGVRFVTIENGELKVLA